MSDIVVVAVSDEDKKIIRDILKLQLRDILAHKDTRCAKCRRVIKIWKAYKCFYCGLWFCHTCAGPHFEEGPTPGAGEEAKS